MRSEAYGHSDIRKLAQVHSVNRLALDLLRGVNEQRDLLMANTTAFANKLPANNALLWGARGTGKSSLVKAVHGAILASGFDCGLVEIHREDIADLPLLMNFLATIDDNLLYFLMICFEQGESSINR